MMLLTNKIQCFSCVLIGLMSCFLFSCLNGNSSSSFENKSGIYFYIQQNKDKVTGLVSVPKDNKGLVVCVDKKTCEFKDGEIVGVDFVEDLENAKIYQIKDSINLSSKIEAIRDSSNKRKVEISEGKGNFSDVNVGDLKIIQLDKTGNTNIGGSVLNDITSHFLPTDGNCQSYTYFRSSELTNYAHEATHGLNNCIRNHKNTTGKKANGFYLLEGKAVIVEEPTNMKITTVASFVPNELRNLDVSHRYDMYISFTDKEAGRQLKGYYDDTPLYIFDEWVAYINGGKEAISLIESNRSAGRDSGLINGAIEFMVYASALVKALSEKDPSYLQSNTQFKALYKYLFKTTVSVYNQGKGYSQLAGPEVTSYINKFKSSGLYSFVTQNFGDLGL